MTMTTMSSSRRKKKADEHAEKKLQTMINSLRSTPINAFSSSTPGTVYINLSHRTQLKQLTRRAVNAFRDMLIGEKTQNREMNSYEALALIERLVQTR